MHKIMCKIYNTGNPCLQTSNTCIQVPRFFLKKNFRTWVGIEPTPSHLRCAALPVELPSPLGARWWGVGYTSVSFLVPITS